MKPLTERAREIFKTQAYVFTDCADELKELCEAVLDSEKFFSVLKDSESVSLDYKHMANVWLLQYATEKEGENE